jgi:tubby-related protein 1
VDLTDIRHFVASPVPLGTQVQCKILRNQRGLNKLWPVYELYLDGTDQRFLLSSKKKGSNKTSNYYVSSDRKCAEDDTTKVAKLRSNFSGTEFIIYNKGVAPSKITEKNEAIRVTA